MLPSFLGLVHDILRSSKVTTGHFHTNPYKCIYPREKKQQSCLPLWVPFSALEMLLGKRGVFFWVTEISPVCPSSPTRCVVYFALTICSSSLAILHKYPKIVLSLFFLLRKILLENHKNILKNISRFLMYDIYNRRE